MKKYRIDLFGSGGEITIGELENREDFVEDEWHGFDDLHHSYSSGCDSNIVITDLNTNIEALNISFSDYNDKYGETLVAFKEVIIESDELYVCCLNNEKGNTFSGCFEIEESESFQVTNFNIEVSEIIFGDYSEERITNISYKGKSIENVDFSTRGSGLTVEFIEPNK
jgi:hypothetical protein